jgi:co-chaperonin GroES (HSP10)
MPLSLLRDRIQVLPDPVRDDVSSAGIVIAASKGIVDSRVQFGRRGTVIAVGADIDQEQLKAGDVVLWGEFTFPEYREDGVTYAILQDKDLTAVLEADLAEMSRRSEAAGEQFQLEAQRNPLSPAALAAFKRVSVLTNAAHAAIRAAHGF